MLKKRYWFYSLLFPIFLGACNSDTQKGDFTTVQLENAAEQTTGLLEKSVENNKLPRSYTHAGTYEWTHQGFDWTEGFFPGTCWYLYEHTHNEKWKKAADKLMHSFEPHKNLTTNHDLGFVFNCSYGNAYRLTGNEAYKQVLIDAANSLSTRFSPRVGCIQSWDVSRGWQSKRDWQFPVIIDNMMNLELLFEASKLTDNPYYKNIAIKHAETTLKNHFRADNSSFHVIDYDSITGEVRKKETAQGFAHESEWARGQAWGLYGYTVCYRYTKDPRFLHQAEAIANLILSHKNLPKDLIPYWDFDAPKQPNEPRDASAAAITASALIELDAYSTEEYADDAQRILESLSNDTYSAKPGENGNFIIKHCVGSIPHGTEIDVPLSYADYYYVEALVRLNNAQTNNVTAAIN